MKQKRTKLKVREKADVAFRNILLTMGVAATCISAQAESVTNWHTFKASPATTLSGQGTSSPVMGSAATTSSTGFLMGYMDTPLSLANVGDKISFTYSLRFNDATGMAAAGNDNFRFALFDLNGQSQATLDNTATAGVIGQTDDLRGYWFGVRTGPTGGSIRELVGGQVNPFANANVVSVAGGTISGGPISYSSAVNGVGGSLYYAEMTLEKTGSGLSLSGYFGGNGATNFFSAVDSSGFPGSYGAVGFFNGSALNADQILPQDVTVTLVPVPEPSTITLITAGLFATGFHLTRRRSAVRNG
jgi:hypothetical protein